MLLAICNAKLIMIDVVVLIADRRAVAVDVVSQLMYYTDGGIYAMKLGGGYPFLLVKSGQPRDALVLDHPRG